MATALASFIAGKISAEWPTHAAKLAGQLEVRYQKVLQNIPHLPPNTESRWLTLHNLHAQLIPHLLASLPFIALSPEGLLAEYEASLADDLLGRWCNAVARASVVKHIGIASQFLDRSKIPIPLNLSDALLILTRDYNLVCNALRTFPRDQIASELKQFQCRPGHAMKIIRILYEFDMETTVPILKNAGIM